METERGFNFIATTFKGLEREAIGECLSILRSLGDPSPSAWTTGVIGLMVGQTALDPFAVVGSLKKMVSDEPWSVRLLLRFIPIERVCQASPDAAKAAVVELSGKVGEAETFRVTVEKRHNDTPTMGFVTSAASALGQKVNLDSPDWVVLVEVIGGTAGVSVLRPSSIFSSPKSKRGE